MFNVDSKSPLISYNQTKPSHRPSIFITLFCFFLAFASLYFVLKDSQKFLEQDVGGNSFGMEGVSQPSTPRVQSVPTSPIAGPTAGNGSPSSSMPGTPNQGPTMPNPSPMLSPVPGNPPSTDASEAASPVTSPKGSTPGSPKPSTPDSPKVSSDAAPAPALPDVNVPKGDVAGPSGAQDDEDADAEEGGGVAGTVVLNVPADAAAVIQEEGSSSQPAQSGAKCTDAENGYEAQYGLCRDVRIEHKFQRTAWESTYIPMVVDQEGHCKKEKCTIKDKWRCCKFRRLCDKYKTDVKQGCTGGKVPNPYEGAFCRTHPCTTADADICCIEPTGAIYKRTDMARSKYARIDADDSAKRTVPHISFSYGIDIWTDISQKVTVGDDEWVPLVNFMESWGPDYGWSEPAWIKFSKNKRQKYEPVTITP